VEAASSQGGLLSSGLACDDEYAPEDVFNSANDLSQDWIWIDKRSPMRVK
jgi:hypothetical protein